MFSDDDLLNVPFKKVVFYIVGLPLSAIFICLILALILHFEGATRTHCRVENYLPSISAAIGDFSPEKYIWRLLIALHCLPRFAISFVYKTFYLTSPTRPVQSIDSKWFKFLCCLITFLHLMENGALLTLSMISSSENHDLHEFAFIIFIVTSLCYMLLTLYVFNFSGRRRSSTLGEKSFQVKLITFSLCLGSFLLSVYFYWRHNAYCEAGVYTFFALCEYIVVLTNIAFHATVYYDFPDKKVTLISTSTLEWKAVNQQEVSIDWKAT